MVDKKVNVGRLPDGTLSVCRAKPGNEGRYGCHHVQGSHEKMTVEEFQTRSEAQAASGMKANAGSLKKGSDNAIADKPDRMWTGEKLPNIRIHDAEAFNKAFNDRSKRLERLHADIVWEINKTIASDDPRIIDNREACLSLGLAAARRFNADVLSKAPESPVYGTIRLIRDSAPMGPYRIDPKTIDAFNDANILDAYDSIAGILPKMTQRQSDAMVREHIDRNADDVKADMEHLRMEISVRSLLASEFDHQDNISSRWNIDVATLNVIDDVKNRMKSGLTLKEAYDRLVPSQYLEGPGIKTIGASMERITNPAVNTSMERAKIHARAIIVGAIVSIWV